MSKQSSQLPSIQQTHHIPGHFFSLLHCCVQALLHPWVPINAASNPCSVCLFLGECAPAEQFLQQDASSQTAHLSATFLGSVQSVAKNRIQAQISLSSSLQTCERCLLTAVSSPKDIQTLSFLCVLLELSHVKSIPLLAAWYDIMPCPREDSHTFYKTAPCCILSLNKKG